MELAFFSPKLYRFEKSSKCLKKGENLPDLKCLNVHNILGNQSSNHQQQANSQPERS
jgi:hypothetical protein